MIIDKLAWVRVEDGALLVVRSHNRDLYYLPGGKREAGESDQAALFREVREELGVALRPETVKPLGEFEGPADGQAPGTRVRLRCYAADYQGTLAPAAEIAEMAWLRYADRAQASTVAQLVFDALRHGGSLR